MAWKIPLFKIYWDEEDVRMVSDAIKAGMNWATGPNVGKFEELIASYVCTKYALTFNSGTSALHAALLAHGIKNGDEVIVPSFTFIATANAPLFVGAKPVFADIEEETFGLDPEDVKEKITEKTRAEIADDHNLILIEDAAESLGARIGDENMKICYISTKSIHTRRWVEYFAEKGHEVHLITHLKSKGAIICQQS